MPELLFHPETTEEIKSSFDWYQEQVKGLGYEFVQELDNAILIKGNADVFSDIDVEVNSPTNVFKYTFKKSVLTSGPNVVKD